MTIIEDGISRSISRAMYGDPPVKDLRQHPNVASKTDAVRQEYRAAQRYAVDFLWGRGTNDSELTKLEGRQEKIANQIASWCYSCGLPEIKVSFDEDGSIQSPLSDEDTQLLQHLFRERYSFHRQTLDYAERQHPFPEKQPETENIGAFFEASRGNYDVANEIEPGVGDAHREYAQQVSAAMNESAQIAAPLVHARCTRWPAENLSYDFPSMTDPDQGDRKAYDMNRDISAEKKPGMAMILSKD